MVVKVLFVQTKEKETTFMLRDKLLKQLVM